MNQKPTLRQLILIVIFMIVNMLGYVLFMAAITNPEIFRNKP